MTKRNVDIRFLDFGKVEKIGGDKVKQVVKIKKACRASVEEDRASRVKDARSRSRRASRVTRSASPAEARRLQA